jgi:Family of unknown function (DUF6263)
MKIRRAGVGVVAAVGVGLLAMAAAPAARAQVKLEYKFPEGQTLTYKSTTKVNQVITINGMEIPTEAEETTLVSQATGKRAGDSTLPVKLKVESHRTDLTIPGGIQITYDTKDPNAKIDNEQLKFLEDVFKLAGQIAYTIVLDDKNKIKAVEGTEAMLEKADKLDEKIRSTMRSQLNADKLKSKFEQSHQNVPDVLARPGESWERTETFESGDQGLKLRKKYEYAGTEKKGDKTLDKITSKVIEVKLIQEPNDAAPLQVTKSDLKVELSEGTILFDREAGCAVETREKLHIKGTATYSIGGQELPGELDVNLSTSHELVPGAK